MLGLQQESQCLPEKTPGGEGDAEATRAFLEIPAGNCPKLAKKERPTDPSEADVTQAAKSTEFHPRKGHSPNFGELKTMEKIQRATGKRRGAFPVGRELPTGQEQITHPRPQGQREEAGCVSRSLKKRTVNSELQLRGQCLSETRKNPNVHRDAQPGGGAARRVF